MTKAWSWSRTAWGQAHRLLAPLSISGTPLQWDLPAVELVAPASVVTSRPLSRASPLPHLTE